MYMVSLIIPTRRGAQLLDQCLQSVRNYTNREYELIIVDFEAGFNDKLNYGISQARGEHLIFLHDDCEVTQGWLDEIADLGVFCLGNESDAYEIWGGFFHPKEYLNFRMDVSPDFAFFAIFPSRVIQQIYPLDPFYKEPWCQDVDLGYSIRQLGYRFTPIKGKIIHHAMGSKYNGEQTEYTRRKWNLF